jgi:hypothetical protein
MDEDRMPYFWHPRSFLDVRWMRLAPNLSKESAVTRNGMSIPSNDGALSTNPKALKSILQQWKDATLVRLAGGWTAHLATDSVIRICPACLAVGYQAVFFQIAGLLECPIHHLALQSTCVECGAQLPEYADAAPGTHPMRCARCKRALMAEGPVTLWCRDAAFRAAEKDAWFPLARWLRRLASSVDANHVLLAFPREEEITSSQLIHEQFPWVLNEVIPLPSGYRWAPRPRSLRSITLHVPSTVTGQEESCVLTQRAAVFRSIRRHILKTYFHGRVACLDAAHLTVGVLSSGGEKYAQCTNGACDAAQAFVVWHYAIWRKLQREPSLRRMAARRDAFELRESDRPYQCDAFSELAYRLEKAKHPARHTAIEVWARKVLAEFFERLLAIRTAREVCEAYERRGECLFVASHKGQQTLQGLQTEAFAGGTAAFPIASAGGSGGACSVLVMRHCCPEWFRCTARRRCRHPEPYYGTHFPPWRRRATRTPREEE